jgi:hypothetical protein
MRSEAGNGVEHAKTASGTWRPAFWRRFMKAKAGFGNAFSGKPLIQRDFASFTRCGDASMSWIEAPLLQRRQRRVDLRYAAVKYLIVRGIEGLDRGFRLPGPLPRLD